MSIPDFVLDKRVVQRNIAKGLLTRDDLAKWLVKLPDVEDNAEPCMPDPDEDAADESE